MTEKELTQLLKEFQKNPMGRWGQIRDMYTQIPWPVDNLIVEIKRLRALIKDVESCVYMSHGYAPTLCPWCMCEDSHALDCPAFTPEGDVK